jgi:hypothetical protein
MTHVANTLNTDVVKMVQYVGFLNGDVEQFSQAVEAEQTKATFVEIIQEVRQQLPQAMEAQQRMAKAVNQLVQDHTQADSAQAGEARALRDRGQVGFGKGEPGRVTPPERGRWDGGGRQVGFGEGEPGRLTPPEPGIADGGGGGQVGLGPNKEPGRLTPPERGIDGDEIGFGSGD